LITPEIKVPPDRGKCTNTNLSVIIISFLLYAPGKYYFDCMSRLITLSANVAEVAVPEICPSAGITLTPPRKIVGALDIRICLASISGW
jgi:hypothetical protein